MFTIVVKLVAFLTAYQLMGHNLPWIALPLIITAVFFVWKDPQGNWK